MDCFWHEGVAETATNGVLLLWLAALRELASGTYWLDSRWRYALSAKMRFLVTHVAWSVYLSVCVCLCLSRRGCYRHWGRVYSAGYCYCCCCWRLFSSVMMMTMRSGWPAQISTRKIHEFRWAKRTWGCRSNLSGFLRYRSLFKSTIIKIYILCSNCSRFYRTLCISIVPCVPWR